MSIELFNQLEQKVQNAVDTIEMLKMETEELREENTRLKQERDDWERRLGELLGKFQGLESEDGASS
ncbi:cell division protein ZapB [Halomonas sp. WWR20]